MKICVTTTTSSLDAPVDPRFGRCPYFVIVDSETMQYEAISNPALHVASGAGIQAVQLIANKGVEVVITGKCRTSCVLSLIGHGDKGRGQSLRGP